MGNEEAYTRTRANNFLKKALGIPKKSLINERFFNLFFLKESDGVYFIKKPESLIESLFTSEGIIELNKVYYQNKLENKTAEAKEVAHKVMTLVKDLFTK